MNVLILGSGGREHAFAWKISQSPLCNALYIGPGNAGTASCGSNLGISPTDFPAVKAAALKYQIDMIVVGPEAPLADGIYDYFAADPATQHINIIGPSAAGARLESSKAYAKTFMQEQGIPTAAYRTFTAATQAEGIDYIGAQTPPIVLKADGLAAGKGVLICQSISEAQAELRNMLSGKFGQASEKVVIESFLDGIEFSVFALTDGKNYQLLPIAKDLSLIHI